jgi:hypothetical protein
MSSDYLTDFFGTWKAVDYLPNVFLPTGVLQPFKYLSIARDVLGKEIEFQAEFYRFDKYIFDDIEYQINAILPDDYEKSEFLYILNHIEQLNGIDGQVTLFSENDIVFDTLHTVYIKGIEDENWPDYDEDIMLALLTTEFVVLNERYIYHLLSGLICERIFGDEIFVPYPFQLIDLPEGME